MRLTGVLYRPPMIRAFISHIDCGSDTDFIAFGEDVNDALIAAGFDAKSTLPWNADSAPTLSPLLPPVPAQPNPLQPPPQSNLFQQ